MSTDTPERDEWDGIDLPYNPGDELDISEKISLHTDAEETIDPVTYEVIRHSMWNMVLSSGHTVENLAISPITVETRDFQTAAFTETGEFTFFGPYIQYFGGIMDLDIKWILENQGENPGINEGDMFLTNDPWIGVGHQADVALVTPIFHDGEIFSWAVTIMHQNDVGGTVAGSFCPNAEDVYWEPPIFPPMKIVEDGEVSADREAVYRRQSRTPTNLAMDLRAAIAANNRQKERTHELIEKYGADTVKGVMRGVIDDGRRSGEELLSKIPDGTWRERIYNERSKIGDDGTYRYQLTLTKEGSTLTFDNGGTEAEAGTINLPFCGWRGAIVSQMHVLLEPSKLGAPGGLLQLTEFDPEPGTLTCPRFGAAVSPSGLYAAWLVMSMANNVLAKMLMSAEDDQLQEQAMAPPQGQAHVTIGEGTNQRDDYYVAPMLDQMIGCTGPTPTQDGDFANGQSWIPETRGPNVELYERKFPILELYRGEHSDTGGAGKYRSGNGGRVAFTPHHGTMTLGVYTPEGIPKTPALLGGYPGSRGETKVIHDSDVAERLADDEVPTEFDELDGTLEETVGKGDPIELGDSSVVEWWWGSSSGYGDPLDRDPERVAADVRAGSVSETHAEKTYGVVLDDEGEVDQAATLKRRERRYEERLEYATTVEELLDQEDE